MGLKAKIQKRLEKGSLWFLAPLSVSYQLVVALRHALFDKGVLKQRRAPLPVVSIGNLVVGGTGKTQVVLTLAKALGEKHKVAIVSRGYGSLAEKSKCPTLITPKMRATDAGDEPTMLAHRLPEALVIAGKNRLAGCCLAKKLGADVVLLDDGMQHRRLARDFELVVIDGAKPFGSGRFLPWGNLRELPSRLQKAHLVLVGGENKKDLARIRRCTEAPQVGVKSVVKEVLFFNGGQKKRLEGEKVALFCGIAHPSRFLQTARALGAEVVHSCWLSDHQKIGNKKIEQLTKVAKAKGAKIVLCTEKDYSRLKGQSFKAKLPLAYVKMDLKVTSNGGAWKQMLTEIVMKSEMRR